MSRDQKKSPTAKSLRRVELQVDRVTRLVRSVVLKFPSNTLPQALLGFMPLATWSFRLSSADKNEVVLTGTSGFHAPTVRFPAWLLDAQDSEVTKWARVQYWSGVHESRQRIQNEVVRRQKQAKTRLETAQREVAAADKAVAMAFAPTSKQRRAREKQFGLAK